MTYWLRDSDANTLGLISDHALEPGDDDAFAHDDFVEQLAGVVESGVVSANIALFGAWGSGKSGISKRLHHRLKEAEGSSIEFVELNALKYSSSPLLRSFVAQLADELLPAKDANAARARLYENVVRPSLKFPENWQDNARNVIAALAMFGVIYGLAIWVFQGPAEDALLDVARTFLPTAVPIAAIIAFTARVLPSVVAKVETPVPVGPEEFERIFRKDLIEHLGFTGKDDRRLVMFVDELDRCSPQEVADALEALRTFLHVPGVVFIVAADRRALEHALTLRVRQATPLDRANPYYSAGSAYLDKIFELQLDLPPLLPGRLVDFAINLVDGKKGVWDREIDVEEVLSVLLPVHVHSPRRVKVLLNRYAMEWAIAEKRALDGRVSPGPVERAAELAKLVCLKTEFPRFCEDLEDDARLTTLVVEAADALDDETDPATLDAFDGIDTELLERAIAYAKGERPVADLLADRASRDHAPGGDSEPSSSPTTSEEPAVAKAHTKQLVNYLLKTRAIAGPHRDLIHMEGAGAVRGIDPAVAQQIETDALNNQPERVVRALQEVELTEAVAGLRVLGDLLRGSRGNDADNVIRSLIQACGARPDAVNEAAAILVPDVEGYARRVALSQELLPGVIALAAAASNDDLAEIVLTDDRSLENSPARNTVLREARRLPISQAKRDAVMARCLFADSEYWSSCVETWPSDWAADAVGAASAAIVSEIERLRAEADDGEEAQQAVNERVAQAFDDATARLRESGHATAAELLLPPLLAEAPSIELLYTAQRRIQRALAPIQAPAAVNASLQNLVAWHPTVWLPIVNNVSLSSADPQVAGELADELSAKLAKSYLDIDATDPLAAIEKLWLVSDKDDCPRAEEATARFADPATSAAKISSLPGAVALLHELGRIGVLARARVAAADVAIIEGIALATPGDADAERVAGEALMQCASSPFLQDAGSDAVSQLDSKVGSIGFVSADTVDLARMSLATSTGASVPLTPDELAAWASRSAGATVLRSWLKSFSPSVDEVLHVFESWFKSRVPGAAESAVQDYCAALAGDDRSKLAFAVVDLCWPNAPTSEVAQVIDFSSVKQVDVATNLIGRLKDIRASEQPALLRIWQLFDPTDEQVRKQLIQELLLPMAEANAAGYDAVRRYLTLAIPPPYGTKQTLVKVLESNAPDDTRAKKMRKRMDELGLAPRKKRFGLF